MVLDPPATDQRNRFQPAIAIDHGPGLAVDDGVLGEGRAHPGPMGPVTEGRDPDVDDLDRVVEVDEAKLALVRLAEALTKPGQGFGRQRGTNGDVQDAGLPAVARRQCSDDLHVRRGDAFRFHGRSPCRREAIEMLLQLLQ